MLTDDQRKLAEDNHRLIYGYAYKKQLDIDEYYGILAIGFCKAAKAFDNSKRAFSTFAYACMENEVLMYLRSLNRKSNIPCAMMVSIDEQGSENLLEDFSSCHYQSDEGYVIILNTLKGSLTETQNVILELMLQDETQEKISKILGCTQQNVWYNIQQIRKQAKAFY